jgi:hypothetical protein
VIIKTRFGWAEMINAVSKSRKIRFMRGLE